MLVNEKSIIYGWVIYDKNGSYALQLITSIGRRGNKLSVSLHKMIPIETWYLLYVYLLQKPSPHSSDRKKLKKKIQNIRRHLSTRIQWLRMEETPLDPTANAKETKGNVVLDRITFTKTLRIISNASQSIPLYAPRVADWLLTSTRVSSFLLFLNFL